MKNSLAKFRARMHAAGFTPEINRQIGVLAIGCVVASALLMPELAMASGSPLQLKAGQGMGQVAGNIKNSLSGVGMVITAVAYVFALGFTIGSIFKFKAHSEHPDRVELKVPVGLLAAAAGCAGMGELLGTGIASIWGSAAQVVQAI